MPEFSSLEIWGLVSAGVVVVYAAKKLWNVFYTFGIGPAFHGVDFKSKGKWALVTGCTDGIGKEYARQLAAKGCNIILVSRSLDKLQATAQEIQKEFKVATKVIQVDFNGDEDVIYKDLARELNGMEIGTLVNNVGIFYSYPEYLLDIPDWDKLVKSTFRANMMSVTKLTHIVLQDMVKRGKGVVINLGSAACLIPSPMLTLYSASKIYVDKFTESLEMEYGHKGITFQVVHPGAVVSKMSGYEKGSSAVAPMPEDYVRSALRLVGTTSNTTGYFKHSIFVGVVNFFYAVTPSFAVWLMKKAMEGRKKELMKIHKIAPSKEESKQENNK